ncbi:EAL domain-containing protein [Brevibacillus fluminis]|uniref:EAL domain-containing protein n=1 Tax=Brevibacillus fluminis TaxID=511487 RepID=A0A3M8D8U1_9BACL|nr:EAL domain-containing protein [Brevibacillus fluminis]RNB84452.1 EAL domain-containing protein [Brevibacillus fluminis]
MEQQLTPFVTDAVLASTIFEQTIESIMITDKFGVIRRVNPAFSATTGYAPAEVIGQTPRVLNSGIHDRLFFSEFWNCIGETGFWSGEIWNRKKDGEIYLENLRIAPLREKGTICGYIAIFSDITAHRQYEQKIQHQLGHDSLTGLVNRMRFLQKIEEAIADAQERECMVAVVCMDLHNFKSVNESLGTAIGDLVLQNVASQLLSMAGPQNTVARIGGDEFAILMPLVKTEEGVHQLVQCLIEQLKRTIVVEGHELFVTTSVGVSLYPQSGMDPDELIKHADSAMYRAMELGGGSYEFYTEEMSKAAAEHVHLGSSLSKSLEREELIVCYQPQLELPSGRIIGMEALLRWRHPELGLISPASFIPLAEETGLIVSIGEWVLRTACQQTKEWQDRGFADLRVAVNLSARQFQQEDLVLMVDRVLGKTGLPPQSLELEITESIAMNDENRVITTMHQLKRLGVRLAIDDFGTGYSSLSYLSRFPLNNLKIDQSFIQNVVNQDDDAAITKAIVSLAKALGLQVTAEGVETKEQLAFLEQLQCNKIQGYYVSKPLFAEEFEQFLQKRESAQ